MMDIRERKLSLRRKAAQYRQLSKEYGEAGALPIAAKLAEVAAELDAEANALGRNGGCDGPSD